MESNLIEWAREKLGKSEEPEVVSEEKVSSSCNHGQGEPDKTFYHETKDMLAETWTFEARDTHTCDDCGSELTVDRELATVEIDDDENLVIQNE